MISPECNQLVTSVIPCTYLYILHLIDIPSLLFLNKNQRDKKTVGEPVRRNQDLTASNFQF